MAQPKKTKAFYNTEIPGGWKVKRFDEFAPLQRGFDLPVDDIIEGEYPVVFSNGILKYHNEFKAKAPGVVTGRSGTIGKVSFVEKDYWPHNTSLWVTDFKGNEPLFVYFYIIFVGLNRFGSGSGVPTLNRNDVHSFKVLIPPLPEQKAIAKVLSKADAAIHTTERLIAQKELRKKWLMQQLLTGKKRLKGFGEGWKEYKIHQLFKPESRYVAWDEDELYNLISIRRRNGGVFFREPLLGSQIGVKKLKFVLENDFVISKRQVSHGAWAVIDPIFSYTKVSDEYNCLVIKNEALLLPDFWKWYCQLPVLTHYANIDSDGVHIEKSIFDFNLFKRRKVLIPSSQEEQKAIAQVLKAADKEISLLKAKAEKLREQKKGLMQVLLTGKVRLKVDNV